MENRHGLIVESRVWEATGTAEHYAALDITGARSGKGACDCGRRQGLRHRGIRERVSPPGHEAQKWDLDHACRRNGLIAICIGVFLSVVSWSLYYYLEVF